MSAAEAVRNAGCEVVGMVAIFTYNFQKSVDAFNEANVKLITLSNYNILIEQALETGYITNDEVELLNQWRIAPDKWKKE